MTTPPRYAIITPYHKEDRYLLQRCIDSVKRQSVSAHHFMIADGEAQSWIDLEPVRHIKLDRAHGDFGNTPRGVGALIAVGEEYDGIGLLDADNWLDHDHVEACLQVASTCEGGLLHCDYVIARRRLRRPDETIMPFREEPEHVDTNCYFFLRGSFAAIPRWAAMPKALSAVCDRVFYAMLRQQPFKFARVGKATVNYLCTWQSFYRALGEISPAEAKPNIDRTKFRAWANALTTRELEIAARLSGIDVKRFLSRKVQPDEDPLPGSRIARNALCPCGSGKKFKHCHGNQPA